MNTIAIDTSIEDVEYTLKEAQKGDCIRVDNKGNGILTVKSGDLSIPVMPNFAIQLICTGFHSCLVADKEVYYYDQILIEGIR